MSKNSFKRRITMADNKEKSIPNIELFERQTEVINRVNILNQQGYREEDMYIITSDENEVSVLRGLTDIVIKEEDASIWDRFKSFLKGEDTIIDAFNRLDLDDDEKEYFKEKISEGKYLLFVDKEYGSFNSLSEDFQPITEEQRMRNRKPKLKSDEEIPDSIKRDIGLEEEKTGMKGSNLPHDVPQTIDHDLKDRS